MGDIVLRKVTKIFGPTPARLLDRVRAGVTKEELLAQTGHTIGVRDVSLTIEAGKCFVVMGLSGSGKSTLVRHLNRLIEPTAGEILFDGKDILRLDPEALRRFRRDRTSMVFQRFALFPHKTVLENVAYGLNVQARDRAERRANLETARRWIERVGLAGYEAQYPSQLSGGMQQRVGLARALATDAEVMLMDEAFSALDPLIRREMQDQLIRLQTELHRTIVFITPRPGRGAAPGRSHRDHERRRDRAGRQRRRYPAAPRNRVRRALHRGRQPGPRTDGGRSAA